MATEGNRTETALDAKQDQAIMALLADPNIKRAAESIGVGERTLHRWLDDPTFSRAFQRARRMAFNVAIGMSQKYAGMAVQTLAKVMADSSAPHSAKVAAATSLLKFSRESIELDELAGRLDDVEARLSAKKVDNTYGSN